MVSEEEFKLGMRRLVGGVNIVTARLEGEVFGWTATAVSSLTAKPPRMLACVNRELKGYDLLCGGGVLTINILRKQQVALAKRFGAMDGTPVADRFNQDGWDLTGNYAPILKDALAAISCEVESLLTIGTHGVAIGRVSRMYVPKIEEDNCPLTYLDGTWGSVLPLNSLNVSVG